MKAPKECPLKGTEPLRVSLLSNCLRMFNEYKEIKYLVRDTIVNKHLPVTSGSMLLTGWQVLYMYKFGSVNEG